MKKNTKLYELQLTWSTVEILPNGTVRLHKCNWIGPVLKDFEELPTEGSASLDFTFYYSKFITKPYLVPLSWNKLISQSTEAIKFKHIDLEDSEHKYLHNLKKDDSIVLNMKGHHSDDQARGHYKLHIEASVRTI